MDDAVVDTEKNRKLLSAECVVYLKADIPVQVERMSNTPSALLPMADQKIFLETFHRERDPLFEGVATFTVETHSIEADVKTVLDKLGK
jgi:shikimate kinase